MPALGSGRRAPPPPPAAGRSGALLLLLLAGLGRRAEGGGEVATWAADGHCRPLKAMEVVLTSESACYCYVPNGVIHLKNIWSSIQVKISSKDTFKVVPVPEERSCQDAETLLAFFKCIIQNIWQSGESNETTVSMDQYGERTCFRVQAENKAVYSMSVQQTLLDKKLFFLFATGGLLFHFAYNLSRSVVFYYSAGVAFGILATLVFLLLMLKRFIPKLSTFWILMSGCCFCSLYFLYTLKEDLKQLWYDHTPYLLGYVLLAGSVSLAVCYQHGPLASEHSMDLLMWALQLTGLTLIYFGIAIPQVAGAAIAITLCSKILHYPLQVFCSVGRKTYRFFRAEKPEFRYLTEDEYREQGESETIKALEDLRNFCRSPDFPSWVAVVKLQSPQKFAKFVLGFPDVSPEETDAHSEQYGLGGALLEEQLFTSETGSERDQQTGLTEEEEEREQMPQPASLHARTREFL